MKILQSLVIALMITTVAAGCGYHDCCLPADPPGPLPDPAPICQPVGLVLVLGGGGSRGMAHVGVLKEFEEAGIPIDVIVGCSAGAVIGALYCDYPCSDYIKGLLGPMKKDHFLDINFFKMRFGVTQGFALKRFLYGLLGDTEFCHLTIPLLVVATDLDNGELVCIGGGRVVPAVQASSALPFYLPPVYLYGRSLVDGGVADQIPVACACDLNPQIIVAVDLSEACPKTIPKTLFGVAKRCAEIKFLKHNQSCLQGADIIIRPEVGHYDWYEDRCNMIIYEAGREAAREAIPLIKAKLAELADQAS